MGVNTWYHANSVSFKCHSIRVTFKICAVLGAQGIRATGFRRAQGNQHCAKFESHTNRVTFETNAISITSSFHAHVQFPRILPKLCCVFYVSINSKEMRNSLKRKWEIWFMSKKLSKIILLQRVEVKRIPWTVHLW